MQSRDKVEKSMCGLVLKDLSPRIRKNENINKNQKYKIFLV